MIKNNNICNFQDCKKKIKLTDFYCKCNKIFCTIHRLPEYHDCSYNYKLDKVIVTKIQDKKKEKINFF